MSSSGVQWETGAGQPSTDEQVMDAIREGDREALQIIVDRYWARLIGCVQSMVGSPDAAEDVAQAVFVTLWRNRSSWTAGSPPWPYLFRLARNLALDGQKHRRIRDRKAVEIRRLSPKPRLPIEESEYLELRRGLDAALNQLPERRRQAFLLVRIDGLTLAEAADVMGVARQTVANHVHLALMDLRVTLARFIGELS